jgi:hypothetical protein
VETFNVQVQNISGYLADTRLYKREGLFYSIGNPVSPPLIPILASLYLLFLHVHPFPPLASVANQSLYPASLIVYPCIASLK